MPEAIDPRIGVVNEDETIAHPEQTLSGRLYRKPAQITRSIGNRRFVVIDPFPPKDFDVEAVIAELSAQVAPAEAEAVEAVVEVAPKATPNAPKGRKELGPEPDATAQPE